MTGRIDYDDFYGLILRVIEGQISDEDFFALEAILQKDRCRRREYVESVLLYAMLHKSNSLFDKQFEGADLCSIKLWEILAEDEKNAPAVAVPKMEPSRPLIQKVEYKRAQRKFSKSSLLTVLVSAAALLFFIFYAALTAPRQQQSPLGLITQVQEAAAAEHKKPLRTGAAVYPETLTLQKGSMKVELDSGVELVIASPSQIVFETKNSVLLNIGSLVAAIPPQAVSFTVRTPLCSVVDYGTEFGISVDAAGQTQVEVFKGKVDLRDNPNPLVFGVSRFVTAGQIGRFDLSGEITIQAAHEVPAENKNTYVRGLPIEWAAKTRRAVWNDSANWDKGLPNLLHAAFLKDMKPGTACQIDASHSGAARAQAHYINVGLRGYGCLEMSGGQLETNEIWIGRQRGGQGLFTLTGGTVLIGDELESKIVVGGAWEDGGGGQGLLDIRGGSIQFSSDRGSVILGWGAAAEGTIRIESAELIIPGQLRLGRANDVNGMQITEEGVGTVYLTKGLLRAGSVLISRGRIEIDSGTLEIAGDVRQQAQQWIQNSQITSKDGQNPLTVAYDSQRNTTVVKAAAAVDSLPMRQDQMQMLPAGSLK